MFKRYWALIGKSCLLVGSGRVDVLAGRIHVLQRDCSTALARRDGSVGIGPDYGRRDESAERVRRGRDRLVVGVGVGGARLKRSLGAAVACRIARCEHGDSYTFDRVYPIMDEKFERGSMREFHRLHFVYLNASTLQWGVNLALLAISVWIWRERQDD